MITIEPYNAAMAAEWDAFVAESRNATFLLRRGYMDYHSDRFSDFSLVARDARDHIIALLPACREGSTVWSHRGLTYGGWIVPSRRCDVLDMLDVWSAMEDYLRAIGVDTLVYKPVPHIYHTRPAEEDLYALFRSGAVLTSSLASSIIDLDNPIAFDQGTRQRARKVLASDISFGPSTDWDGYWAVLTALLRDRYDASPVHTCDEIKMLAARFPDNIRLYTATLGDEILGGIVLYVTPAVAHSQYAAASPRGKELSVLHGLYQRLIEEYSGRVRYFDFGTSADADAPRGLNEGLVRQKCSYGGRTILYNTYTLHLQNVNGRL